MGGRAPYLAASAINAEAPSSPREGQGRARAPAFRDWEGPRHRAAHIRCGPWPRGAWPPHVGAQGGCQRPPSPRRRPCALGPLAFPLASLKVGRSVSWELGRGLPTCHSTHTPAHTLSFAEISPILGSQRHGLSLSQEYTQAGHCKFLPLRPQAQRLGATSEIRNRCPCQARAQTGRTITSACTPTAVTGL